MEAKLAIGREFSGGEVEGGRSVEFEVEVRKEVPKFLFDQL